MEPILRVTNEQFLAAVQAEVARVCAQPVQLGVRQVGEEFVLTYFNDSGELTRMRFQHRERAEHWDTVVNARQLAKAA